MELQFTYSNQPDYIPGSIAQLRWPKERVSTILCSKCGDCFHLDLHRHKFDETLRNVRSGCSPDGVGRVVYSNLVADVLRDAERCQSELLRLQDLSNAIEEQQQLLFVYLAGIRSLESPIHKLPSEILVEVFKYVCCDGTGANCILLDDEKRLPTLTLSRVCIRWYDLITSTPVLWSSFGTQDLDSSHNLSLFKVFLERSHFHPIDFEVNDPESSLNLADDSSESSFDLIIIIDNIKSLSNSLSSVTTSARWRHVKIHASASLIRALLQPLIARRQNMPVLVSLDIGADTPIDTALPITCPNLQRLTLDAVIPEFEVPQLAVTHLILDGFTPEGAFRVITRCPNVRDITLNDLMPQHVSPSMASCGARRLAIKFGSWRTSIMAFLSRMDFPELVHLELSELYPAYDTLNVENLHPMLERNHRHLTHLFLHSIKFASDQLVRLFLCVPTVTVLDLEESWFDNTSVYLVLKALIVPLQQNQLEEPDKERDNERDNDEMSSDSGDEEEDESEFGWDDGEDEKSLDLKDKARNIEVFEGQCLLPRLEELNLVIRPRNTLLLQLVRSRWRPTSLPVPSDDGSHFMACVCLQTLRIKYPGAPRTMALGRLWALKRSLSGFKKDGMVVDVSV